MDYSNIRTRVDEIHESYMEDVASDEYTQAHEEVIELLDADDVDVDELQQALRDLVDATRSAATEAGIVDPDQQAEQLIEVTSDENNWEVELAALEADADRLGTPQLSDIDGADDLEVDEVEHSTSGIDL